MPQSDPRAYTYTITAGGRLNDVDDFRNIYLRTNNDGSSLRLEDVARVELGASSYGVDARLNGSSMAPIIINQQPGANALETAQGVREAMEDLSTRFPPGLGMWRLTIQRCLSMLPWKRFTTPLLKPF